MKGLLTFLMLSFASLLSGQKLYFQHGLAFSLYFGHDLKFLLAYNPNLSYPLGNKNSAFLPMLDLKLGFYNNNLGSSTIKSYRNQWHIVLAFSPTVAYSFQKATPENPGYIPVFTNTFLGLTHTDYDNNIGFSVSYVYQYNFGKRESRKLTQRVGGLFISTKYAFIHYYNDGGPVLNLLGDKEDRYWTGGGTIGSKFTHKNELQYLMLTFDKYSGFNKGAFEASGLLYTDNVNYQDIKETTYNRGKYSLIYLLPSKYFGISLNHWNTKVDFQDFIHRDISTSPYHFKLEKPYFDIEFKALYEK